ncbi:MmcQ/YjbR family DNA-binding protein [Phocaeicola faecalis]|uniref:MmcQ/YjbR family DNA-binding protein n=1 Tax=Phocaeicola faecalis TaxID=2786956 RepID=UPI001F277824|nr:MmcQ/YjbR family DNA-binding protein [Phocaeicola faecalis]
MNIEDYRAYCLSMKGATECMPFDKFTLVYKVMNKMISYAPLNPKEGRFWANVKCDPDKSAELMERYEGICFGPHSDKKYWITILLESDVPDELIKELINHSVDEVIKKLPKKKQEEYRNMH